MKKKLCKMLILCVAMLFTLCGCDTITLIPSDTDTDYGITLSAPYSVIVQNSPTEDTYYFIGSEYIDEETMSYTLESCDAEAKQTSIEMIVRNGCTKCDIWDATDYYSYYCEGNLIEDAQLNILQGNTIFIEFQNLVSDIVYEEEITSEDGPQTHMISNASGKASDLYCSKNEDGSISKITTTTQFSGYDFDAIYLPNAEDKTFDISNSVKIEKSELLPMVNTMADYMFASVIQHDYSEVPDMSVEEEPEEAEEPEVVEEPETYMMQEQIATLSDEKDLFVKLSFSNNISSVEFVAPTGGSYKVESGNVEFMLDDNISKEAYYRIPNAEPGNWQLIYDNKENEITTEVVTDNKIKIQGIALSAIKDGIITVSPKLSMEKGLNIDYEYHIDIIDAANGIDTIQHTSNILNSKNDKADYKVSVMDLPPGTYKVRLRLEYMYDGQHYINIFTSDVFSLE